MTDRFIMGSKIMPLPRDPGKRPWTYTLFRLRWEVQGGHTHVRVFAGKGASSLGKCGDLVFRNEEWKDFLAELDRRPPGGAIEILEEGEQRGDGGLTTCDMDEDESL